MIRNWPIFLLLMLGVLVIWAGGYWVLAYWINFQFPHKISDLALLGDSFGTINTLFSGLAFAVLIYTIKLQSDELKKQSLEIETSSKLQALNALINYKMLKIKHISGTTNNAVVTRELNEEVEVLEKEIRKIAKY